MYGFHWYNFIEKRSTAPRNCQNENKGTVYDLIETQS